MRSSARPSERKKWPSSRGIVHSTAPLTTMSRSSTRYIDALGLAAAVRPRVSVRWALLSASNTSPDSASRTLRAFSRAAATEPMTVDGLATSPSSERTSSVGVATTPCASDRASRTTAAAMSSGTDRSSTVRW